MTKDEALKLALEALEDRSSLMKWQIARDALKKALAQPEQEPVAWLITDEKINSLQVDSIQRLIDRTRHAHMTDIKLRINGQDEWFQADWLKHLTRTTPPQRKPLTGEQIGDLLLPFPAYESEWDAEDFYRFVKAIEAAHGIKDKNT